MAAAKYPLLVVLPRGRVTHSAKLVGDGPRVTTLCHKSGIPADIDPKSLPWCADCASRPNPISQQRGTL